MKVFVTGGTGFVGSQLVKGLLKRGEDVVCLVRNKAKAESLFSENAPQFLIGDLWNQSELRSGCRDADVIYHSAALTTALNRREFFSINADATLRVVQAAAETAPNLTRFVYIGSLAAAGPSHRGRPRTEDDPVEAVSDYGASKLAGEDHVRASGLPWTVIRPCAVYGPGDAAFLKAFKIARRGFFPVMGSASQELSLVHISDLTNALLGSAALTTLNQEYFACHPEIVTSGELAQHIGAAVVRPQRNKAPVTRIIEIPGWASLAILHVTEATARMVGRSTLLSRDKGNEYLAEAWTCSPAKLEQAIGWNATIALKDGLSETAEWYRTNNWL